MADNRRYFATDKCLLTLGFGELIQKVIKTRKRNVHKLKLPSAAGGWDRMAALFVGLDDTCHTSICIYCE